MTRVRRSVGAMTADQTAADQLLDELLNHITASIDAAPRSQQTAIGPSELGMPCARRLAHKLAGTTPTGRPPQPAWKPTVGTAIHSWLETAFTGHDRWLLEQRVTVGQIGGVDVQGNADLYDTATRTVVDWKSCGPTRLKHYRAHGPGPQYRIQAHLYGRGYITVGLPVDQVMIVFLPRNGELRETFQWSEPYDEQTALAALERGQLVSTVLAALGPAAFAALPTSPADCSFCPYWQNGATDLTLACPGDPSRPTRTDSLTSLVA